MRAGAKFQAAVGTWLEEDGSFRRSVLGSIPLREGTDQHRVERIFCMFADMLDAVKALADFFGPTTQQARDLTLQDLMAGIDSFLGDHGEHSVLVEMREQMRQLNLGSASLRDPAAAVFFFCHFVSACNNLENLVVSLSTLILIKPRSTK